MSLFFSRDTKVYLQQGTNIFEIPVLEGYSFSQGTNTSEVTLAEAREGSASTKSRRSKRMFNDSLSPAEWSFSTYVRPIDSKTTAGGWDNGYSANSVHSVEEALWANFVAKNSLTSASSGAAATWSNGVTNGASTAVIDWTGSEVSELGTFDLFFKIDSKTYKLTGCCVNEATIDFDIDGVATINWSGFGSAITEESVGSVTINDGISSTDNFIRNRLTSLTITAADTTNFPGSGAGVYNAILTGGSLSFNNNITFLTPETLGKVDKPLGHVTGARNITGNFTCYLDSTNNGDSDQLFTDLASKTNVVTNDFSLAFNIGGTGTPSLKVDLSQCHLEVPTHSIEDVISLDVAFHGLTDSLDPGSTADSYEAKLTYNAVTS